MNRLLLMILILFSTTSYSFAESRPYIGITINNFSINGSDTTATNLNTGLSSVSSNESADEGVAVGLVGGVTLNDSDRWSISYFSGKENDSSIMTVEAASIAITHSFNNFGIYRGWFIGVGFSKIEVKTDKTNLTSPGVSDASGFMLKGGFEYKFDNQLLLDIGFDGHFSEIDQVLAGRGSAENIEVRSTLDILNIYMSLIRVF